MAEERITIEERWHGNTRVRLIGGRVLDVVEYPQRPFVVIDWGAEWAKVLQEPSKSMPPTPVPAGETTALTLYREMSAEEFQIRYPQETR